MSEQCDNCRRRIEGVNTFTEVYICADCRRMYRHGWEAGWSALIKNGVYRTDGPVDTLADLTAPQVAALADRIDTEQRWRDEDEDVTA